MEAKNRGIKGAKLKIMEVICQNVLFTLAYFCQCN